MTKNFILQLFVAVLSLIYSRGGHLFIFLILYMLLPIQSLQAIVSQQWTTQRYNLTKLVEAPLAVRRTRWWPNVLGQHFHYQSFKVAWPPSSVYNNTQQLNSPNTYLDIWGNVIVCTIELKKQFTWLTPKLLLSSFTTLTFSHTVPQSMWQALPFTASSFGAQRQSVLSSDPERVSVFKNVQLFL